MKMGSPKFKSEWSEGSGYSERSQSREMMHRTIQLLTSYVSVPLQPVWPTTNYASASTGSAPSAIPAIASAVPASTPAVPASTTAVPASSPAVSAVTPTSSPAHTAEFHSDPCWVWCPKGCQHCMHLPLPAWWASGFNLQGLNGQIPKTPTKSQGFSVGCCTQVYSFNLSSSSTAAPTPPFSCSPSPPSTCSSPYYLQQTPMGDWHQLCWKVWSQQNYHHHHEGSAAAAGCSSPTSIHFQPFPCGACSSQPGPHDSHPRPFSSCGERCGPEGGEVCSKQPYSIVWRMQQRHQVTFWTKMFTYSSW